MLPLFFLLTLDNKDDDKRQQLVESIIPSMVPGPPTQRVALSAVLADGQIDAQRNQLKTLATEVTTATAKASANANKKLADTDLNALPTLSRVIARSPEIRQQVDAVATAADQHEKRAVEQAGTAVFNDFFHAIQRSAQNGGKKLSETDLVGFTALAPIMNRNQGIKNLFFSANGGETIDIGAVGDFPGTASQRPTTNTASAGAGSTGSGTTSPSSGTGSASSAGQPTG
jgi:hypothetical protein